MQVAWTPPSFQWMKVNVDGSLLCDSRLASCGDIARDHNGNFVAPWSLNLGHYTIIAMGLWAMFWGLLVSPSLGFNKVLLETDSRATVELVEQEPEATHAHAALISSIKNLLLKDWSVEINHAY